MTRRSGEDIERVLVVGLGSIGSRHLRIARELLPEAEFGVLRRESSKEVPGAKTGHVFTKLSDAIAFRPQAAVIANPAPFHLDAATALADAGAHLLIEKPISSSQQGVSDLIARCRSAGLTLMTGYNLRFLPSLARLKELVSEGRIGRLYSVHAEVGQFLPAWRPGSDYAEGVSANAALGGGALLELSHEIDYLLWLLGDAKWVFSVQRQMSDLKIDVEDTAHLTIGFGGAGSETIATVSMDFLRHDSTRTATLVGETGTLRWDATRGSVEIFERDAKGWKTIIEQPVERDESYTAEWKHFLNCIASGTEQIVSGEDGLAVLQVIDAARASNSSGCVVAVEKGAR